MTGAGMADETVQARIDRARVDDAYDRMNQLWPLHGAAALGAVYQTPHPRAAVLGLDHAEVDRILAGIHTFFAWGKNNDWIQQWVKAGHGYSERAEVALGRGHHISAGEFWRLASVCYFFASYVHFHLVPVPARDEAQALSIAAYRKAGPLLCPAAERVDVPFQSRHLPGYLRVPTGGSPAQRWPCAIVLGGTNSTKEENHPITTQFLNRGIATFVFDGPGQNEYLQDSGEPMRMTQVDKAVTSVVDWLQQSGRVDPDRIALLGRSSGGICGLHAASAEHRLKAVVAHPGSYKWTYWKPRADVFPVPLEVARYLGARSLAEVDALVEQEMTLEDCVDKISCPVLLMNATGDSSFPASEAEILREKIRGPVEVMYFERRGHGGPPSLAWPMAADWIADRLGVAGV